jgi:hypothetical protein
MWQGQGKECNTLVSRSLPVSDNEHYRCLICESTKNGLLVRYDLDANEVLSEYKATYCCHSGYDYNFVASSQLDVYEK